MIATTLGEKLALYRKEKKWSQEDLAEHSGVSKTQISRIERDISIPSVVTLDLLEKALGLPRGDLLRNVQVPAAIDDTVRAIESSLTLSRFSRDQMKNVQMIIDLICEIVNEK